MRKYATPLLMTVLAFFIAGLLEVAVRNGNHWVLSIMLNVGKHVFATLFLFCFVIGYYAVNFIVLMTEPAQSVRLKGIAICAVVLEALFLFWFMPR